jgi:hypothetical protein
MDGGAAWYPVQTIKCGARTGGAETYSFIPISICHLLETYTGMVMARVKCQSIVMPSASDAKELYIRDPVIVIQGGKR